MEKIHLNPVLYVHVVLTLDVHQQGEQPRMFGSSCGLGGWCRSRPPHGIRKGEEQMKT